MILSAKGREADVSKGLSLGADAYITKPFSNAELVERIGALLAAEGAPGGA
ncbi:Phosphate regulon transcriptional regulatory protein PhoB [compost metagenome]